jgi:hypothetical protein
MRTSFHHQPEAQHPNFQLSTSWQADYPIFINVRFGPLCGLKSDTTRGPRSATIGCEQSQQDPRLFDHLVGTQKHRRRDGEIERLRGPEIHYQLELRWLLDR